MQLALPCAAHAKEIRMVDMIYVTATLGFFALAWGYTLGCARV